MAESVVCASCGTANEAGRKFCGECGSALVLTCPSCGSANPPTVKFCGECGMALTATAGAPARETPAERRLVTVLFADLVGFTAASADRDAEDTRDLLSRYFDASRRLIELYGGTVEKFIGDAVMAVWGTPTATEDDAERAVRAALDLVAAVSGLGDEVGTPGLRARAGVLTGEAAVTIGAEGQGMVAGDLVNTASRIQSAAEPGTVLVGESTRRATDQTIAYADAGTHELKGKAGLVPLWQALRIVSGARGALKSTGLEAPFVGRDPELHRIKDLFHACADERRPQLISITGIAGIGKSRLAWEFYKYFDGLPQITYWHRGRCLSYGEGVTYWALADMVRMRARIAEDEEPRSALAKLADVVAEHVSDEEERRFVEPRLRHLLGLEESTRFEREDLFAAWRLFFERLADVYPTVMVFEDMQWADASLLDFIEYLLERSRSSPLFVVTLARPELHDRRATWGAATRNFTSIYLDPLPSAAMEEVLSGLVPGLPATLRAQILERAEGIPLYAVETVRMLLDRGALVQEQSVYRPTGTIPALDVPETLHALIAARLDGLTTEERRVIQDASVLGKMFTKPGLAAISGVSEADLEPLLSSLVRKEVLNLQADPRSPERGQYGFLQDLLKRVAYETLSRKERRARHLASAEYLAQAFGAEHEIVEVVAAHYVSAYESAPDTEDAPQIKEKAREVLVRAAERAASLGAAEEAQRYFAQAAELTDDPLQQALIRERSAEMAWTRGLAEEAQDLFEQAISFFSGQGRSHDAARVSARLAEVEWRRGQLETAIDRMERAYEVLEQDEPDEDLASLAAQLGRLHWFHGDVERAAERVEAALEIAETLWLPAVVADALITKGIVADTQGRSEESLALLKHALEVGREHDLPAAALRGYHNLADTLARRERYPEALEAFGSAVTLARRAGNVRWEVGASSDFTYLLAVTGEWTEALEQMEALEGQSMDVGLLAGLLGLVTQLLVPRGAIDRARALLESLARYESSDDVQERCGYAQARAGVLRAEGKDAEALAAAQKALAEVPVMGGSAQPIKDAFVEALEAASALGEIETVTELLARIDALRPRERTPYLQAQAARFRARLAAIARDRDRVEDDFKYAAHVFREYGVPFWLAVTQLEHGEWLVEQGSVEESEPLLDDAREIFVRLEATPWLERLDAVAGRERVPA